MEWKKIKIVERYAKYKRLVTKWFEMPNGHTGEFDVIVDKDNVVVVAFTVDMRVVVFEQFRPGPELVVLNFPGGSVEKGQSPEEAAARELLEETGYVGTIQFLAKTMADPYFEKNSYSYIATNCVRVSDPTGSELEENPVVREIPFEEFKTRIAEYPGIAELQAWYFACEHLAKKGNDRAIIG